MRTKNELAIDKILECAKKEFLEKGFEGASMRTIAEKAGYTTGMVYGRFADKSQLFREVVGEAADKLFNYYSGIQNEFAGYSAEKQKDEMHSYVDNKIDVMIDIVYDNFDEFKLIICKSVGSGYEYYVDKMVDIETENTHRFIKQLNEAGIKTNEVRADLAHILASAMFNGIFEVVSHDLLREDARYYIKQLQDFFNAGWDKLLGFSLNCHNSIK
ncbi:MAG: TetR/AcrR family transcriptional regulator [Anaeroplasma bactoclasticum]|nr:TetR/AcrR family transcriptional regulator [Anaeroplasma bactoclasticum]MCM1557575.1 TetR/AcrR family transcriptional regulator [Anaeroplasma bactoclasticum]